MMLQGEGGSRGSSGLLSMEIFFFFFFVEIGKKKR